MSDQSAQNKPVNAPELRAWLSEWPAVRKSVQELITRHGQRDPSLHFELTLAELELKDLDESVRRISALGRLLVQSDTLTSAELEATGNH
jgi:hypothetical protein